LSAFLDARHSPALYEAWIDSPQSDIWLLDDAGELAGYSVLKTCELPVDPMPPGALELSRLYLLQRLHGSGFGTVLLETVFARVEERGRPPLFLSVFSGNVGAQRLYQRHGFRQVGEYLFEVGGQRDREFIFRRD
jgi:diamine N-acetyltransferase